MIRLLFMLSVMLLGMVFLLVPDGQPYDFFLFADMKVTAEWYTYYVLEHVIIIIFAVHLMQEPNDYPEATSVFLIAQIVELIDFVLTYNMVWFYIKGYPITFNVIKVFLFTLVVTYGYSRNYFTGKV